MRSILLILSTVIGVSLLCAPVAAQVKTAKQCRAEWQANKADFQAKKIKEKDYVKQCTGGSTATKTTPAADKTKKVRPKKTETKTETKTAPAPITTAPEPAPATRTGRAPQPTTSPAPRPSRAAVGPNQFTTESQAKTRCGSDTVVWANLEVEDLPLLRLQGLRRHEARGLYVRARCHERGHARGQERKAPLTQSTLEAVASRG